MAVRRLYIGVFSAAILLSTLSGALAQTQQNLPSMGEPADTALSPIQERELGAQFMRQIRATMPLVRDVQISEYIESLGLRLARASGKSAEQTFHFFVIDDDNINAFAIPGGYVGVNAGLIAAMDEEEQLAGVLAHEVAHVTQRHHARAFALGNQYSIRTAATILAAILIGQASAEAGQAALAAGIAANQQSAINFTRGNEVEADRIGIEILSNAGFNPIAMAESFSILRHKNRLNTSSGQLQYLRTHPLDNNRIAEARDRANSQPARAATMQHDYQIFKARLAVLSSTDAVQLQRMFKAEHAVQPNAGNTYGLALLHERANRLDEAINYLDKLDKLAPAQPMAELTRADVLENMGDSSLSRKRLAALIDVYPGRYSVVEKLLTQLVRESDLASATSVVKGYLQVAESPNPLAWRQLAGIQQQLGETVKSHESLSRYFMGLDEPGRAMSQLKMALQQAEPGSQDALRLEASLSVLKER